MAAQINVGVIDDHRAAVARLRPVPADVEQPLGQRLVLGAFRIAGQRPRVRRWVARQIAETDYTIAGPMSDPDPWHHGRPDLRCWVLPESHAS